MIFKIFSREKLPEHTIPTTPSRARKWVNNLPIVDMPTTTKLLFNGLHELNVLQIDPVRRIDLTEIIRPQSQLALEYLQKNLNSRHLPLPEKSRNIARIKQKFLEELAGSYQLAALDIITTNSSVNAKVLSLTIYRALFFLDQMLLHTYRIYSPPPDNCWHDIHHLYSLACQYKIKNNILKVESHEEEVIKTSIQEMYIRVNLLAMAKPYSLRQGEAMRLHRFFQARVATISLSNDLGNREQEYAHIAYLNRDEPASYVPTGDVLLSPAVKIFELGPLLAFLQKRRQSEGRDDYVSSKEDALVSTSLARRVLTNLTTARNRDSSRFPKNEKIAVVTTLATLVQMIAESQLELLQKKSGGDDTVYLSLQSLEAFAPNDYHALYGNNSGYEADNTNAYKPTQNVESTARIQIWDVENSSAAGYGLRWEENESSGARVGELIGLRDLTNEAAQWQVGVIRWMEFQDKMLQVGVQLLSPKALPVSVKSLDNRQAAVRIPLDGLMLPSIEGVRPQASLIFPAGVFRTTDEITLSLSYRDTHVKLTQVDENTGSFSHFLFESIETRKQEAETDDFATVWDSL